MKIFCFEVKYIGPWFKFISDAKIRQTVLSTWVETENKIIAIKKHRELTGSGLWDAKQFCDTLQIIADRLISYKQNEKI